MMHDETRDVLEDRLEKIITQSPTLNRDIKTVSDMDVVYSNWKQTSSKLIVTQIYISNQNEYVPHALDHHKPLTYDHLLPNSFPAKAIEN